MKKILTLENIHLLLGANIILWLNAASYGFVVDSIPSSIKLGLVGLWVASGIIRHANFLSKFAVAGYLMGLFYVMCLLSDQSGIPGYYGQYGMNLVYILIMIAVFAYYFYFGTKEEIKFLLIVFFIDVAFVTVRTFIKLQEMPHLVRMLSTSEESKFSEFGANIPKGIGGYGLCYELIFLQPTLAYILNRNRVAAALKLVIYGWILVFLFQAQITLAFMMYPVVVLISYTFGQENRASISVTRLVLIILSVVAIIALPSILEAIIAASETHLAVRLEEVLGFLTTQQLGGNDMQARMKLYQRSIDVFMQSPVWGAFGTKAYGSHSTLLDILAAFGVAGLIGYFGMFRPVKLAKKHFVNDAQLMKVINITQLAAVILSIVNVLIGTETMLTLLVIVPLAAKYFTEEKEEEIETDANKRNA